jgi:hypothetical protein
MGCNCSARGIGASPQKRMGQLGQTAGVPAGSVLAYSASWPQTAADIASADIATNVNLLQSRIQGNLAAQWGIVVDSQSHSTSDWWNFTGQNGFVLQVHTTSDYGAPSDIQKILDSAIYGVLGTMPSSTIRVVQAVSPQPGGGGTFPPQVAAQIAAAQAGYADAIARGDQVSAAQFAKLIAQSGGQDPRGVVGWFADNWQWLAAALGGVVAVKELL